LHNAFVLQGVRASQKDAAPKKAEKGLHEKEEKLMRRTIALLAAMAMMVLVAASVAWAATVNCPNVSGTNTCNGTANADILNGSDAADYIDGKGGNDVVKGNDGDDNQLWGGVGKDKVLGGLGNDVMWGGDDRADDELYGGRGNDYIYGGWYKSGGVDKIFADRGNDTVDAYQSDGGDYPEAKDIIDCGPGTDSVYFKSGTDQIKNCENRFPNTLAPPR
jgi:hypothetical protein